MGFRTYYYVYSSEIPTWYVVVVDFVKHIPGILFVLLIWPVFGFVLGQVFYWSHLSDFGLLHSRLSVTQGILRRFVYPVLVLILSIALNVPIFAFWEWVAIRFPL